MEPLSPEMIDWLFSVSGTAGGSAGATLPSFEEQRRRRAPRPDPLAMPMPSSKGGVQGLISMLTQQQKPMQSLLPLQVHRPAAVPEIGGGWPYEGAFNVPTREETQRMQRARDTARRRNDAWQRQGGPFSENIIDMRGTQPSMNIWDRLSDWFWQPSSSF